MTEAPPPIIVGQKSIGIIRHGFLTIFSPRRAVRKLLESREPDRPIWGLIGAYCMFVSFLIVPNKLASAQFPDEHPLLWFSDMEPGWLWTLLIFATVIALQLLAFFCARWLLARMAGSNVLDLNILAGLATLATLCCALGIVIYLISSLVDTTAIFGSDMVLDGLGLLCVLIYASSIFSEALGVGWLGGASS